MLQQEGSVDSKARGFVNKDVPEVADAIKGAKDIIAEWVNEDASARQMMLK